MKRILALLLAVVMALGMTACGKTAAPAQEPASAEQTAAATAAPEASVPGEPVYGGSATFYYNDFNTVFDPAMGEQYTYSLWLEYLFTMDWSKDDPTAFKNNNYTLDAAQGQIADSWTWDPDTHDFTVTIRDDIYFQQKDAPYDIFHARNLTAADVKYSYDRVIGTGSGFDESNYVVIDSDWRTRLGTYLDAGITSSKDKAMPSGDLEKTSETASTPGRDPIEVLDDYTLVFHMATDSEIKLSEFIIAQVNIVGPEWDTLTDEQKLDWHYACGTGPYILTDYVADNHYTFTKNDNYYDTDERNPENKLPYLDSITLQKYADSTSILSDFFAGKLDYIASTANLSDSEIAQLTANSDCAVFQYPYAANGIGLKLNQAPFSDKRVRIAMQKAINLEEVATAYYGYDELILPGLWDSAQAGWSAVSEWDDELKSEYAYDPEGAKALLAEAGYPDGFSFTVAIDSSADPDLFELAKGYFAAVGITMDIQILSDMSEGRQVQGDSEDPRQYNLNLGNGTDAGFCFQTYATTGFAYCNFAGDTHFDELLAATRDAASPAAQAEAAKAADLYFSQTHFLIALSGVTTTSEFYSARIGGNQDGELLSAYHFVKTILPRLWAA